MPPTGDVDGPARRRVAKDVPGRDPGQGGIQRIGAPQEEHVGPDGGPAGLEERPATGDHASHSHRPAVAKQTEQVVGRAAVVGLGLRLDELLPAVHHEDQLGGFFCDGPA